MSVRNESGIKIRHNMEKVKRHPTETKNKD